MYGEQKFEAISNRQILLYKEHLELSIHRLYKNFHKKSYQILILKIDPIIFVIEKFCENLYFLYIKHN